MDTNMSLICVIGVMFLVAIIFFSIGIGMLKSVRKKKLNCIFTTKGKVVDIVKRRHYDNDGMATEMLHPVFEYIVENQKYTKESHFGTTSKKYGIGQEVAVHYNPNNCEQYYVEGENTQKILGIVFTSTGGGLFIVLVVITAIVSITTLLS